MSIHFKIYRLFFLLLLCCSLGLGFVPSSPTLRSSVQRCIINNSGTKDRYVRTQLYIMKDDEADFQKGKISPSSPASALYPVISKIAGKEWTGTCRYVNANLQHATKLKLHGGVKLSTQHNLLLCRPIRHSPKLMPLNRILPNISYLM